MIPQKVQRTTHEDNHPKTLPAGLLEYTQAWLFDLRRMDCGRRSVFDLVGARRALWLFLNRSK
jgi:hypothetical protein